MRSALLVAVLAASEQASAEAAGTQSRRPANTLTVAPLNLLFQSLALEYERVVHPNLSLLATPTASYFDTEWDGAPALTIGVGGGLGGRFFVDGEAPDGLFGALQLHVGARKFVVAGVDQGWVGDWSAVTMVGWSFLIGDWFVTSVGAGLGFGNTDILGFRVRAFVPAFRLNVGAAF